MPSAAARVMRRSDRLPDKIFSYIFYSDRRRLKGRPSKVLLRIGGAGRHGPA